MSDFAPLNRRDALSAWRKFLSRVPSYGRVRNVVQPDHANVSRVSSSIRFRTLLEDEVLQETLGHYSFLEAEKWLQEVCWRRYWKGWLETRPQIWTCWRRRVRALPQELSSERLRRAQAVMAGESGIACMDAMAGELIDTGYLHNHARMWWASFWVHVEELPWELGADFFFRNLLDADPASNTLSWRWVAGLHTAGKSYLVRLSNIEKYAPHYLSGLRSGSERLADGVVAARVCEEQVAMESVPVREYPTALSGATEGVGIWLHHDDLTPEIGPLANLAPRSIAAVLSEPVYRGCFRLSSQRIASLKTVLQDGLERAAAHFGCPALELKSEDPVEALCSWAMEYQLREVVALAPMIGPVHDMLPRLKKRLEILGIRLTLLRRGSDATAFSFVTGGFFPFWQRMRRHLSELYIS